MTVSFAKDRTVFISYSHDDDAIVTELLSELKGRGFDVSSDRDIVQGRWGNPIAEKLTSVHRVISIITENVFNSNYGNVYEEMRRACEMDKLVPLCVGLRSSMPYDFQGLIARIQTYRFDSVQNLLAPAGLECVTRACGGSTLPTPENDSSPATALDRARSWLSRGLSREPFALACALAVFEQMPLAAVQRAAGELRRFLPEPSPTPPHEPAQPRKDTDLLWQSMLKTSREHLETIEATTYQDKHPRLGTLEDYCKFRDPERARALFAIIYRELDQLREPIDGWLKHLAGSTADERLRLGVSLGYLAQESFASVFGRTIEPWALDDDRKRREVADIALCFASFDESAACAIRQIVASWAERSDSLPHIMGAVQIACGYTGTRIQGLCIETLRAVSEQLHKTRMKLLDMVKLLETIEGGIKHLLSQALETRDNSLLNLPQLIADLAHWVTTPDSGARERLPMYLFLSLMNDLPVGKPERVTGMLSLSDIVDEERTVASLVQVLSFALREPGAGANGQDGPRELARAILARWADSQRKKPSDPDRVLELARKLLARNHVQRDRDRIVHLFRAWYTVAQLGTVQAPDGRPPS